MNNALRTILIILASIYLITVIERFLSQDKSQTDAILTEQREEYKQLNESIDSIELIIHKYEIQKYEKYNDILTMSSSERDSLRAMLNPR